MSTKPKIALVLSGGGSRGAYEAGVMLYLRNNLSKRLGYHITFDIITGTSVGAINGAFLAATNEIPDSQGELLAEGWKSLSVERLIGLGWADTAKLLTGLFTRRRKFKPGQYRHGGLLNTEGLEKFVIGFVPWRGITRNIRNGHLESLCITGTHIGTGHTIVFLQSGQPIPDQWTRDPFVQHRDTVIGPRHVLASASIPMFFPAVRIGASYYTDGGLRQNTPLSPAIRLGADKVFLISLRHRPTIEPSQKIQHERELSFPKPLFLLGKALNALLLDSPRTDLNRLDQLNAIMRAGIANYGKDFPHRINAELLSDGHHPVQYVDYCHISPSVDIGTMASDFVRSGNAKIDSSIGRKLLEYLAGGEAKRETDLLSYLLFDGDYAAQLIELGYQDAAAREEELCRFFSTETDRISEANVS